MTRRLALILATLALPWSSADAQTAPRAPRTPAATAARPAPAPPPVAPGLSLAEAETMLVSRNLALVAARSGIDAARAQILVANSIPPPSVSLGSTVLEGNELRNGGAEGVRYRSPVNNVNLGLNIVVERGGKRGLRRRFAEDNVTVAEAQLLDTLRGQVFALRQSFINALLARANRDIAAANRVSLDRTEALLRRQSQEGAIPEGDLLRFQAARLPFDQDAFSTAQAYAAAVASLAATLAVDATAAPPSLTPRGRIDRILEPGLERAELVAALNQRPDVVVARRQAEAAASNRLVNEGARSRDVSVAFGFGRTQLSQNLPNSTRDLRANDSLGVTLSVPIFTRGITEGNIGVAAAQQAQAEALARAALLQAQADFATAWSALEQARALRALYDGGALRRAEEAYAVTERAYLGGGRSLVEVLDSLRTLNATRVAANQARAAHLIAIATLEQATGASGLLRIE